MRGIFCSATCFMCSEFPRMASRRSAISGFSVFTRPSRISGNRVRSETSRTGIPFEARRRAVPPVETISTLRSASARANSTIPVLSYTLITARSIRLTVISRLSKVAVYCFPDVEPDVGHIRDGMGIRDGGDPELRRCLDHVIAIGQFRRASKPIEQTLALRAARVEEAREVAGSDQVMIAIENDAELSGLRRHQ